jgi:hypothetical protein
MRWLTVSAKGELCDEDHELHDVYLIEFRNLKLLRGAAG